MAGIDALVVQAVPGDGCISGGKSHKSHALRVYRHISTSGTFVAGNFLTGMLL